MTSNATSHGSVSLSPSVQPLSADWCVCTHEQWQKYLTAASAKCSIASHSALSPRIEQTTDGDETTVWWVYASGTREALLKIVRSGSDILPLTPKLRPHQLLWLTPFSQWSLEEIRRWGWPKNLR